MKIETGYKSNSSLWPINVDGQLPVTIIDHNALGDAFFRKGTQEWGCTRRAVRQALKALGRRYNASVPEFPKDLPTEEKDRLLVWAVCSNAKVRKSFRELEIYNEGDGPGGRRKLRTRKENFAELLWDFIIRKSDDQATAALGKWSLEIAKARPEFGTGRYLTADILRDAISTTECPTPPESLAFSQNIVLFASLMPHEQCLELISEALSLGATLLTDFTEAAEDAIAKPVEVPQPASKPINAKLSSDPPLFTIDFVEQTHYPDLPELAQYTTQQELDRHSESDARLIFGSALPNLLQQSTQELSKSIEILNKSHHSRNKLSIAKTDLDHAISEAVREISAKLHIYLASPEPTVDSARDISAILFAARQFDGRMLAVADWLNKLRKPAQLAELKDLNRHIALYHAKAFARKRYASHALDYFNGFPSIDELKAWLLRLESNELLALITGPAFEKWNVPNAVLIRFGIERHDPEFVSELTQWLVTIEDTDRRRSLMRFLDPASSIFDADRRLRRLIVVERLREIMSSGPLAAITDQSIGLTDPAIVGRLVASIINLLAAHLNDIQSAADIAGLLSPESPRTFAADQLIRFIRTPATLTGYFRRLREVARESFFMPLIKNDRIDPADARRTIEAIDNGTIIAQVVRQFHESDETHARLDTKHETQLIRYLKAFRDLLSQTQQADGNRPLARKEVLSTELKELIDALSTAGPIGEEQWVEAHLKQFLLDPFDAEIDATLLGRQTSATDMAWSRDDTIWARSELDLAQFYQPNQTLLDICAASLAVVGRDRAFSAIELSDQLVDLGLYRVALDLLKDRTGDESLIRDLKQRIDSKTQLRTAKIDAQLSELAATYGTLPHDSYYYRELGQARRNRDVKQAEDLLELLSIELADAKSTADKALAEAKSKATIDALQRRLLDAGVALRDGAPLSELEASWIAEFARRSDERVHLETTIAIFNDFSAQSPAFHDFVAHLGAFKTKREDPLSWLRADRSKEITEFLRPASAKLASWASSAAFSASEMQSALAIVFEVHLQFVLAQVQNIRSLDVAAAIDGILEHLIEYADAVRSAPDPAACIAALRDIGELNGDQTWDLFVHPSLSSNEISLNISEALTTSKWQVAIDLARRARSLVSDDFAKRIDDIADFASTMLALDMDDRTVSAEMLEISSRALGTTGHPVHRAIPTRLQVAFAVGLTNRALQLDEQNSIASASRGRLLGASNNLSTDLFKAVNEAGRFPATARVLELLLTGALSSDLGERIWSFATGHNDQVSYRTEFLRFLYEHGCQEAMVRLALRFDPGIKTRLEQLLDLRATAVHRQELRPAANALAELVAGAAKSAPFRLFLKRLPTIGQTVDNAIEVVIDEELVLRETGSNGAATVRVPMLVTPGGMVPEQLTAQLSSEDDVVFAGKRTRLITLSDELMYVPTPFSVEVELGASWLNGTRNDAPARFKLRLSARTITQEIVTYDIDCSFRKIVRPPNSIAWIDNESILEFYPGVGSTPAEGANFVGRSEEIDKLHNFLVGARQPTPILLTGMRRVGKTSLLYAFHRRHRNPGHAQALTIYLSIAEQRSAFLAPDRTVADTLFRAIIRAVAKPYFPGSDHNKIVGERLREVLGEERNAVKVALNKRYDPESFADSLMLLSEAISHALGGEQRVIFLIDEAETLVVPYNQGGAKRIELEQLLQSLREVAQTTSTIGLVLAGSNHIVEFAREYKNAFFGSCARVELSGITDLAEAERIISPVPVRPFVQFDADSIEYGVSLCAGMPQFMWQIGAAAASLVRGGPAGRGDIRSAVGALVNERSDELPFKPYDVLEPLEHMLSLHGSRERDYLWLLLRRVAINSSLANAQVSRHFIVEQTLLELDTKEEWNKRLRLLVELDILAIPQAQSYAFKVPIFAEAFRASRNNHEQSVRLQRVSL